MKTGRIKHKGNEDEKEGKEKKRDKKGGARAEAKPHNFPTIFCSPLILSSP